MENNDIKKIGIFITGGTGFVGSNLIIQLLAENKYKLFCLVRPSEGDPRDRLKKVIEKAAEMNNLSPDSLSSRFDDVLGIAGDLTKPLFGIDENDLQMMKDYGIKQIWHSAAFLRFEEAFRKKVFETNVNGTMSAIQLALELNIDNFNFISTAFVAGTKNGIIPEGPCDYASEFKPNNPYEESKRVVEDFLAKQSKKVPFNIRIFRPPIIIGHSETYKTTSDFSFYGWLYGCYSFMKWVINRMPEYYKHNKFRYMISNQNLQNFMPVNILVEEAIAISKEKGQALEFHHLTNPYSIDIDTMISFSKEYFTDINFTVVKDDTEMNLLDEILENKLYFYSPYFLDSKTFERRRPLDPRYKHINYTVHELINYANAFIQKSFQKLEKEQNTSEMIVNKLERRIVHCRFNKEMVYYVYGEGKPLLIINSIGASLESWNAMIMSLSKNYRIIIWEPRGLYDLIDSSTNKKIHWGIDEQVNDIKEILDNENIDHTDVIVWSSGAKSALKFYSCYSSYIKSFVFVGANLISSHEINEFGTEWAKSLYSFCKEIISDPTLSLKYMKMIAQLFTHVNKFDANDAAYEKIKTIINSHGHKYRSLMLSPFVNSKTIENYAHLMLEYFDSTVMDMIDAVDVPTLIISGDNDKIVGSHYDAVMSKKIKASNNITISEEGHWLICGDKAEELALAINDFLTKSFIYSK